MAEVRLCFGRGAHSFAHKIYNRHLIGTQNKQGKSAIQASSLSAGFLLGEIQNGGLHGTDRAAVGVSPDSYTRVIPLLGNVNIDDYWENAVVYGRCIGVNKECSLIKKPQVRNIWRTLPRYRTNANFQRTFCTSVSGRRQHSLGLCCGHGHLVFTRAYSGYEARSEPLFKTKTGYYDILWVSNSATQVQIKTAYYKQSFLYHPDRNAASEEATARFSEISEAYTVLGNKALRKKYDRGMLTQSDLITTTKPSTKDTKSSAKQATKSQRSVMDPEGHKGVFDFDKFFKMHYSEQLQRQRDIKVRKEEMLRKKQETIEEKKMDRVMEMGVATLIAMAVIIVASLKRG